MPRDGSGDENRLFVQERQPAFETIGSTLASDIAGDGRDCEVRRALVINYGGLQVCVVAPRGICVTKYLILACVDFNTTHGTASYLCI